jgi:hypothetical protein
MPRKYKKKNTIMNVNNQHWFLNDANIQHFQTLTPEQQLAVKQLMFLKHLQDHYD